MSESGGYFRRVGESKRKHRKRVTQVKRIVRSYEKDGRPDLARQVDLAAEPPVRGILFVTLERVCTAAHGEARRPVVAARVNVYTDGRFYDFYRSWSPGGASTEHGRSAMKPNARPSARHPTATGVGRRVVGIKLDHCEVCASVVPVLAK